MNAVAEIQAAEFGEFFAPASNDMIDGLVAQYRVIRANVEKIANAMTGETAGAVSYFLSGNKDDRSGLPSVERLFRLEGALASLNSAFWSKAMHLTDVLDMMPQKRRDEWNKSITDMTCPAFEDETVRATLQGLMSQRQQFLAERVDGIFTGLSGEHVTNSPAAFGKRMIVANALNEYHYVGFSKCGLINDLRCVVAKFMGRDEPGYNASSGLIEALKGNWGNWVNVDGGAMKIRLYKKGTAHIEVHTDMAWRLNRILAHMHPMAIPDEFRQKPKRKARNVELMQRPLPFAVIHVLAALKPAERVIKQDNWRQPYRHERIKDALKFDHYGLPDKHVLAEVCAVLESIGGVKAAEGHWQFDYQPGAVVNEIVASGCVPDHKAHQFYPTPEKLAKVAVELAAIEAHHDCLEPQAGTGGIADYMPMDQTTCVEVSGLRCAVLRAKGFDVVNADFLAWAATTKQRFDRVVMNPPFDMGRWQSHLEAAASMLKPSGRLVAVLPLGAKGKASLPGFNCRFPQVFDGAFAGTSVSVVVMVADKR